MNTTPFDARQMMEFARTWSQYGGGEAEDIMVNFGLTEKQYFERIIQLLPVSSSSSDPDLHKLIRSTAMKRLRQQRHRLAQKISREG